MSAVRVSHFLKASPRYHWIRKNFPETPSPFLPTLRPDRCLTRSVFTPLMDFVFVASFPKPTTHEISWSQGAHLWYLLLYSQSLVQSPAHSRKINKCCWMDEGMKLVAIFHWNIPCSWVLHEVAPMLTKYRSKCCCHCQHSYHCYKYHWTKNAIVSIWEIDGKSSLSMCSCTWKSTIVAR
jgi:hypothetical protein